MPAALLLPPPARLLVFAVSLSLHLGIAAVQSFVIGFAFLPGAGCYLLGFGGGDGPLSGRGSNRSGGASMGAYADFAARMRGADSNRSQRSARSYRG